MKTSITSHKLAAGLGILLIFLAWQGVAGFLKLPLILPTPAAAFAKLSELLVEREFWYHLGATLGRGLIGFSFSLVIGLIIGILGGRIKIIGALLRPGIIALRSTPVISVIILALLWFKGNMAPVVVALLMVLPIITENVIEGIRSVDPLLEEMVRLYQVPDWDRFTKLYIPSLIPFLAAGVSTGLGITWKVVIAAEVLAYPAWGIGSQMDSARVYLQTETVFAWTLAVLIIGLSFDYLLDVAIKKPFLAWRDTSNGRS